MELNVENFDKYTEIDENGVLKIKEGITEIDYSISVIIGENEQIYFNGIGYLDSNKNQYLYWFENPIPTEIKRINKISNITKIIIPSTVKKIGSFAFKGIESLNDIELSEGLEEIGDRSF